MGGGMRGNHIIILCVVLFYVFLWVRKIANLKKTRGGDKRALKKCVPRAAKS